MSKHPTFCLSPTYRTKESLMLAPAAAAAAAASISLPHTSKSIRRSNLSALARFSSYQNYSLSLRSRIRHSPVPIAATIATSTRTVDAFQARGVSGRQEAGTLQFVKYHGLGNDFIMVDNRDSLEPKVTPVQAVKLCDRNFGIGADGMIFVMPGIDGADLSMRIFNSDGSEPEMCGNGIRCFARFIAELEDLYGQQSFTVHTLAGLIVPEIQKDGKVKVDMGQPKLFGPDIPTKIPVNKNGAVVQADLVVNEVTWKVTCVSMGNPHCVTFLKDKVEVDDLKLEEIGPKFEHHEMFPARTNTEFVQILSRSHLKMRVWERGAGATLACGTGACAVVVAAVLEGQAERKCTVDLPGGPLEIEWKEEGNHVYMTGSAEAVFYGSVIL